VIIACGAVVAGYLFDTTGSYALMWILTIGMGVVAGLLNLPIDERQIVRPVLRPL
jgi:cyanate permease